MQRRHLLHLLAPAVCLLGAATGTAQNASLRLDGRVSADVLMGDAVQFSVQANPGLPVVLLLDASPGPVFVFNRFVPIGFTPALTVIPLGLTDGNGDLSVNFTMPASPGNAGAQLFCAAAVGDPSAPEGLDFSNGADLTVKDRNVELAGNSLTAYPFFEHVSAINEGSSVELGIDVARFPRYAGRTVDVYVVAARTRSQWLGNRMLTDARGAPQAVTFGGSTIQANTFTLDTGTLSGATGAAGMGVGYDVVIDLDRNGRFDLGRDLMDGFSAEAGFYVVHDTTQPGPYAVTEVMYDLGFNFGQQDTYFPSNVSSLGQLPLVVVSHGNGHNYRWYDHIGNHLASYGYVVMSHENNTPPGSHTAAATTLINTDEFLGNLANISSGALVNHVDSSRIMFIGHSRGGDGVVRAYDRLFRGGFTPSNYSRADVKLVSSMAPVDFGGAGTSRPRDVTYQLFVGAADEDVNNCTLLGFEAALPQKLHERAEERRMAMTLYGAGHGDFHNQNSYAFVRGPCQIGKAQTHAILRSHLLSLVENVFGGNVPAKDYLWRQYESFRPIGVPFDECIVANLMYQEGTADRMVIDDFQTNTSPVLASSGAAVSMTVPGFTEGRMQDRLGGLENNTNDTFNGFAMDKASVNNFYATESQGSVFSVDGNGDYDITYDLQPGQRDFRGHEYLQFRAALGTRHRLTTGLSGDFVFTVGIEDGSGAASSIRIDAYGAGIEQPYQRRVVCAAPVVGCTPTIRCGSGVGWNNEFETIRIRLTDFLNNGTGIDLADVRKLTFEFGPSFGSTQGRVGLDEIELSTR